MSYFKQSKDRFSQLNGINKKKFIQEIKTIRYLYLDGPKTVNDICKTLKLSIPNSNNIINELITSDVIEKKGLGPSIGGRKPDLYSLKDNSFYVVAIDMGRYTTNIAIFNNENTNISGTLSFSIPIKDKKVDDSKIFDELYNKVELVIQQSKIDKSRLLGIGLVMPGLVNSVKGVNYTYLNGSEKSIREHLEEKFKIPVFIENIAKAIALSEYRFGLAKNKKDVLTISLDWGIGLGMILDGKLYRGKKGFAGEFSHIPMTEEGELCPCGKQGCLETVASGSTLVKSAKLGIEENKSIILRELTDNDPEKLTPDIVVDAALKGDQFSLNLLSNVGHNLGKGIAILIQLLNPELIIIVGALSRAKQYLTIPLQQALNMYCMQQLSQETPIEISGLNKDVGILGAVSVTMEHIFKNIIKSA